MKKIVVCSFSSQSNIAININIAIIELAIVITKAGYELSWFIRLVVVCLKKGLLEEAVVILPFPS